jgi:hypothetical protein
MEQLARRFRALDYFTLGFGTMVGVGWLVVMDDWLTCGGPMGALLGWPGRRRADARDVCMAGSPWSCVAGHVSEQLGRQRGAVAEQEQRPLVQRGSHDAAN